MHFWGHFESVSSMSRSDFSFEPGALLTWSWRALRFNEDRKARKRGNLHKL